MGEDKRRFALCRAGKTRYKVMGHGDFSFCLYDYNSLSLLATIETDVSVDGKIGMRLTIYVNGVFRPVLPIHPKPINAQLTASAENITHLPEKVSTAATQITA